MWEQIIIKWLVVKMVQDPKFPGGACVLVEKCTKGNEERSHPLFLKYQLSPQFTGFIDFPRMPMNHRKRTQESWVPAILTNFSKHPPAPRKAGWCGNHTHVHLHTHIHTRAHTHAERQKPHQQVSSWHWPSTYSMQCHLQKSEEIKILKTQDTERKKCTV